MRSAALEDAPAINALIRAYEIDLQGDAYHSEVELLQEWQRPGFHLDTDAWVVLPINPEWPEKSLVVGYQEIWSQSEHTIFSGDGYVHPQFTGRGVGTAMLHQAELHARQHIPLASPENRIVIRIGVDCENSAANELLRNEGYHAIRDFCHAEIKFTVYEKELRAGIEPAHQSNAFSSIV